jgi:hypothetical protein
LAATLEHSEACHCEETSHYESDGGFCCEIYLSEEDDPLEILVSLPGARVPLSEDVYLDLLEVQERQVRL